MSDLSGLDPPALGQAAGQLLAAHVPRGPQQSGLDRLVERHVVESANRSDTPSTACTHRDMAIASPSRSPLHPQLIAMMLPIALAALTQDVNPAPAHARPSVPTPSRRALPHYRHIGCR